MDLTRVLEVVADGAGTSRMLEVRGPMMAEGAFGDSTASVELMLKDLGLIREFSGSVDCPTPFADLASAGYEAAIRRGLAKQDSAAIFDVVEEWPASPTTD